MTVKTIQNGKKQQDLLNDELNGLIQQINSKGLNIPQETDQNIKNLITEGNKFVITRDLTQQVKSVIIRDIRIFDSCSYNYQKNSILIYIEDKSKNLSFYILFESDSNEKNVLKINSAQQEILNNVFDEKNSKKEIDNILEVIPIKNETNFNVIYYIKTISEEKTTTETYNKIVNVSPPSQSNSKKSTNNIIDTFSHKALAVILLLKLMNIVGTQTEDDKKHLNSSNNNKPDVVLSY